jgi:hypothetical protein
MSDSFFRTMFTSVSIPSEPSDARYRNGLLSSYVQRGNDALVAAQALSCQPYHREHPEHLITQLLRASERYFKAVRLAHGLSATRERDLGALLGLEQEGIPAGPWRERLRVIVALADAQPERAHVWSEWLRELGRLSVDAAQLTPRRQVSRRATPRAFFR